MKNLFSTKDGSPVETENTEEWAVVDYRWEDSEGGGVGTAADPRQIQPELKDSCADIAAGSIGVVSSKPKEHDAQT